MLVDAERRGEDPSVTFGYRRAGRAAFVAKSAQRRVNLLAAGKTLARASSFCRRCRGARVAGLPHTRQTVRTVHPADAGARVFHRCGGGGRRWAMEQHHEPVDSASELLHVARGRPRSDWRSSRALFDGPDATAASEASTAAPSRGLRDLRSMSSMELAPEPLARPVEVLSPRTRSIAQRLKRHLALPPASAPHHHRITTPAPQYYPPYSSQPVTHAIATWFYRLIFNAFLF